MENTSYEDIKDSVVFGFEEYRKDDGYNSSQAAARILEEDWRALNYNHFNKTCFYILIAIESFKTKEIADFIIEKLNEYIDLSQFDKDINSEDIAQLKEDIAICKQLFKEKNYSIIKNNYSAKSRIDYILSLKPED